MRSPTPSAAALGRVLIPAVLCGATFAACSGEQPLATRARPQAPPAAQVIQAVDCVGSTRGTLTCTPAAAGSGDASGVLVGGQGTNLNIATSNASYSSGTEIFQLDVTVQNLLNEAIGTPDGTVADPQGIQVFFHSGPTVTSGSGNIEVANEDGTATFTAAGQPYFQYNQILDENEVSAAKTWQLNVDDTVLT
ncbi:MAG TPA: hypothetical protein VEW03_01970, partial [Longimicrobiaceae bacterium]|nr:hypothetical protein [Longimicrobiaceae bacterium]